MIDETTHMARSRSVVHSLAHGSILLTFAHLAFAQAPAPVAGDAVLASDRTVSQSHRAGETIGYVFDASADSTHLIRVEQQGLDLVVTIEAPDGAVDSYNSPLLRDGPELVLLEAATAGTYRLTVRSDEHTGTVGGHTVSRSELGDAASPEEIAAFRLMTIGGALNFEASAESWDAAAAAYAGAARLWEQLGRQEERAQAVFSAAMLQYWQLYAWDASSELAARAAELYRELGREGLAANATHLQAAALIEQALESVQTPNAGGDAGHEALFDKAFRLLGEARAAHERLGNVYDLGQVINNYGYAHYNRGEFEQARAYFEQAAALMQNEDEWTAELNPRMNLAALDVEAGQLASGIETMYRILELLPEGKLPRERTYVLLNLGLSLQMFGDAEQALRTFSTALEIQRSNGGDEQGEARSLRGIGQTYFGLGELELARQYLHQALPLAEATNDGRTQEAVQRTLGNIAYLEGRYMTALQHHEQALAVVSSASDRAYLQVLAARDLRALGQAAEAMKFATDAHETAKELGVAPLLADALHEAGRVLLAEGDAAGAIRQLESAAALYERFELESKRAEALHGLSLAARAQGRMEEATQYGRRALLQIEGLRARVADPELRALYSASRSDFYEAHIDLLMARHEVSGSGDDSYMHAALHTSERARARLTADLLREASVQLRGGFDSGMTRRQAELIGRLADLSHQRDVLLQQESNDATERRLDGVLAELAATENRLNLLQIELRRSSPKFADLTSPQSLSVAETQAMLDPGSVLLQYALGDLRSFVWVVSRSDVIGIQLADRMTIEIAARRALESLEAYRPGNDRTLTENLAELAELVLTPVVDHIGGRRVVLALDGALQYIPFGVLPVELPDGTYGRLLDGHEIVGIPSMSALAVQAADRREPAPPGTLAVFADPVVDTGDPRLDRVSVSAAPARLRSNGSMARAAAVGELTRLPATGREADAIAALLPSEQVFVARGFAANRETVLGTDLSRFRYIHFATHGLVDSRYPSLSALALSQFDDQGVPRQGFLRLHDVYNLRLNADLVVLSACETALGREIRGEGLIGMTQGFMYAGARSVVASLWQVPDRATAELMTRFYTFMLDDGLAPAAALRSAQLSVAEERRWSSPYFWGGFVLLGDWR